MHTTDQIVQWYRKSFEEFEQSLNGEKGTPRHSMRRYAINKFAELGFPSARNEEWRFTNIQPIKNVGFRPVLKYDRQNISLADFSSYIISEAVRIVLLDGFFSPELSDIDRLPKNIVVESLSRAIENNRPDLLIHLGKYVKLEENAFTALSSAFLLDGVFINIPPKTVVEKPVQLIHIATNRSESFLTQPRSLVIVGENAQATIVESYIGLTDNNYLTNGVTEIVIGKNAAVEHDKLQLESENAFHVNTLHVCQNSASRYRSNFVALGGSIVRNNVSVALNAEGVECTLNGLSLGTGDQLIDNHTSIEHLKPNCNSFQVYKAILDGKAHGVFNGKIFVRKDAQKTDAKQTNKTLLLSDEATINAKPQLEIFADDVKCTHGATVGQLDADQIFYLRSRGIDEDAAKSILTYAFAGEVVDHMNVPELQRHLATLINSRLGRGRKAGNR